MAFVYPDAIVSTAGHVDHGKTQTTYALSGVWVMRHSEEIKKAMTIKLGYTQIGVYDCGEEYYYSDGILQNGKCPNGAEPKLIRRISLLDVPGHEVLVATMVSGAAVVDGALLVVDASQPAPQPQTVEHFAVLDIIGVRHMVVAQNKIDLVTKEKALENYEQIKNFLKGTWAEKAKVVPVSALHRVNIDALVTYLAKEIPKREAELGKPALFSVLRSFNVNPPGTAPDKLRGGVLGGTLLRGVLRVGDEIELRPGLKVDKPKPGYQPIYTKVLSIEYSGQKVEEARPGGLVGIMTGLDPALTKADALAGAVVGKPETLPPVWTAVEVETRPIPRALAEKIEPFKQNEVVLLAVGPATVFGVVQAVKKDAITVALKKAVCAEQGSKVVVIRQVKNRWIVTNYGTLKGGTVALE
ncbi:translation initiation factor IF-2 subunit gamma [Pyrobaculum aerophilum]|uniref:protein-synthesizing GTPase n=1 Tax=Pyrobaculum aerophilum TaxID=13773 RepID=A0A371QZG0_9CREN|nr:translation initiation factor IF-2 subunit gamma [Pyrobaculum aerophilum]RFA96156.1 translation initiation factor IF-2 subunit gamma [Pyrobaculum aerophilum]RFA96300.1 translation initiation factor IF-2 subunit gamma [Pyrobaculum aerophilum]